MSNSAVSQALMAYSTARGFATAGSFKSLSQQISDYDKKLTQYRYKLDPVPVRNEDISDLDSVKSASELLVQFAKSNSAFESLVPLWQWLYARLETLHEQSVWVRYMSDQLPSETFSQLARAISSPDQSNEHDIPERTEQLLRVLIESSENPLLMSLLACMSKADAIQQVPCVKQEPEEEEEPETSTTEQLKIFTEINETLKSIENVCFYGLSGNSVNKRQPISVELSSCGSYVACSYGDDHSVTVTQLDLLAPTILEQNGHPHHLTLYPSDSPTFCQTFIKPIHPEPTRYLVCAGGNIKVYDLQESDYSKKCCLEWKEESLIWDIAMDSPNQRLAAAFESQSVNIYSMQLAVGPVRILVGHLDAVTTVDLRNEVVLSASLGDSTIRRWDLRQAIQSGQIETCGDRAEMVLLLNDDWRMLAVSENATVNVWDQRNLKEMVFRKELSSGNSNLKSISSVKLSDDGKSLIIGDFMGRVGMVDLSDQSKAVTYVECPGFKRPICAVRQVGRLVMAVL